MSTDFFLGKVPTDLTIESMSTELVKGTTDEGEVIYEENLLLVLRNNGKKAVSYIDCTIYYKDHNGSKIGQDSDGSFDICKPNETYKLSIPFFVPDNTESKQVDITINYKQSMLEVVLIWLVVLSALYSLIWILRE